MKKIGLSTLLVLLLSAASASAEPIKIGVITDLSNFGAFWGRQSQLGVEILKDELHDQGVDVEFIYGDSSFRPAQAVSEAQKMISVEHVDALAVEFSPLVNAVAPVSKSSKVLLMATGAGIAFLKDNPYAFKAFLRFDEGCRDVARYWQRNGKKKIGIITTNIESGVLCLNGAKEVYPDLPVGIFSGSQDISTQVTAMKAAGVEALITAGFEGDNIGLLKAMQTLQFQVPLGGPGSDFLTKKIMELFPKEIEGSIAFGYPPVDEQFTKRLLAKDPANTLNAEEAAANAYLLLKQVVQAVRSCPKGDVDCQVKNIEGNGPNSLLRFKGWKDHIAQHDFPVTITTNGVKVPIVE